MSDIYVSSVDGDDVDNGTTWALAKATVAGALAIAADGDTIYVDSAHNFSATSAAIAWDVPTVDYKVQIISVNRNGSTTTGHSGWLAGATEKCGTNAFGITVGGTRVGTFYIYGVTLEVNSGNSASNLITLLGTAGTTTTGGAIVAVSCTFKMLGSAAGCEFIMGNSSSTSCPRIRLKDCTIHSKNSAGSANAVIQLRNSNVFISNLTHVFSGATKSLNFFRFSSIGALLEVVDSDLSSFNTTSGFYFYVAALQAPVFVKNCKLDSTPGIASATWPTGSSGSITLVNVDSADTKNVFEFRNRLGTITENTSIYANSGASFDGSGISWQIVTTSLCSEAEPFITPWMSKWVTNTASMTASLEIDHDSATALHDRNCWADFEYVSSATFPIGTLATTRNAQPFDGSSANLAAGAATWTGTGGWSNENKQKVSSTFTPAEKSLMRSRLSVGIASKTLYLDPNLRVA